MMDNDEIVVRKLIPLEYWRLMDFDDEDFERARAAMNDLFYNGADKSSSQLYKQAGNSIVVAVLETEARVEGRVYEFLAGPFEMPPADVQNMPLPDFVENVTRLTKENDLSSFFTSVRKLAQNM